MHTKEKQIIKKYLPEYDPIIILKDSKILLKNNQLEQNIELNGLIKA